MFRLIHPLIVLLAVGTFAAHADDYSVTPEPTAAAYGLGDHTLVCEKDLNPEHGLPGFMVIILDRATQQNLQVNFGFLVDIGGNCLKAIENIPEPLLKLTGYASLDSASVGTTPYDIEEKLAWFAGHSDGVSLVVCEPDGTGGLKPSAVIPSGAWDPTDDNQPTCGAILAERAAGGGKVLGPVLTEFKYDALGRQIGSLMFFRWFSGKFVELMECNLNVTTNDSEVIYLERSNEDGHNSLAIGSSCVAALSCAATFDGELDASGLNCPLPIIRAKKALGDVEERLIFGFGNGVEY